MNVKEEAKKLQPQIVEWRRALHKVPGIDFDIEETSDYIKKNLDAMGIEYQTTVKTGIVGIIRGKGNGKTIAIRADMDGLKIKEETGLPFASTNGRMHACGHDAHMAMALGAAKILSQNKDKFKGNVKLFFQPAEENLGGAKPMIEEGCLENPKVDAIIGLHIGQLFKEVGNGMIGLRSGAVMASVDKFIITVKGKGGHCATPHICIDPITTASEIITSLQRIISRELNPLHPAVITIGCIKGGSSFNVIPDNVTFEGTVRVLDTSDRKFIEQRIKEMSELIAKANRAEVEIEYINRYPAVNNDEDFTRAFAKSAEKIAGKEKIVYLKDPGMSAEDMAYYLEKIPGTFFFLGSHNPDKGIVYPHHHAKFDVDEDVFWEGTAVFVQAAIDYLND